MQCGSIVNSARGQEIVTLDSEGICWVSNKLLFLTFTRQ